MSLLLEYKELSEARELIDDLDRKLQKAVDQDSEQEVWSYALPVLDATLRYCARFFEGHAVVEKIQDLVSVEVIGEDRPVRAVDVLWVVTPLKALIGSRTRELAGRLNEESGPNPTTYYL